MSLSHVALGNWPRARSHRLTADSPSHPAWHGGPPAQFSGMEQPLRIFGPEDTQLVSEPVQICQAEEQTGFPFANELWLVGGILRLRPRRKRKPTYCVFTILGSDGSSKGLKTPVSGP